MYPQSRELFSASSIIRAVFQTTVPGMEPTASRKFKVKADALGFAHTIVEVEQSTMMWAGDRVLLTLPWELPALPSLIPVSKLSKKLVLVSGIEFPTEPVTKICSHGFLAWLGEVSLPQHPLGSRVRVVLGVSGQPLAEGALWGREGSAGDRGSKAVTSSA